MAMLVVPGERHVLPSLKTTAAEKTTWARGCEVFGAGRRDVLSPEGASRALTACSSSEATNQAAK